METGGGIVKEEQLLQEEISAATQVLKLTYRAEGQ